VFRGSRPPSDTTQSAVAGCAGASCWRTLVRVITRSDPDQRLVATLGAVCPVSDHKRTAIAQVSDTRLAREMVPVECAIRLHRRRAMQWQGA
jgi:hypothetical protein